MAFRYLKTLGFEKFFKNNNICFYFWRVLLVITNPPLYDYSTMSPLYTLIPPFISRKLAWPQKILEVSSDSPPLFREGGWCHDSEHQDFDQKHIILLKEILDQGFFSKICKTYHSQKFQQYIKINFYHKNKTLSFWFHRRHHHRDSQLPDLHLLLCN